MAEGDRRTPSGTRSRIDRDGLKIIERTGIRKRVWLLFLGVAVLVAALAISFFESEEEPVVKLPKVVAAPDLRPPARKQSLRTVGARAVPRPAVAAHRDIGTEVEPEPDFTLPLPGEEPTGIALYPRPGTDPPKSGILVPDDFELPDGYMRHYQATDDGEALPAILLFHPDFDWVIDENDELIEIPSNRVVPPELAPEGLEIEMLELPESFLEENP